MNVYAKVRTRPGGMDRDLPLQDFLDEHMAALRGGAQAPWWIREYARPDGVPEGRGWVQDGVEIDAEGHPSYLIPPADQNPTPLFDRIKNIYGKIQGGPR